MGIDSIKAAIDGAVEYLGSHPDEARSTDSRRDRTHHRRPRRARHRAGR